MSAFIEFKELEAARIQPLLGAISALPGAALVFSGDGASSGAPLFVLALVLIAAAYLSWMCSDAVFSVHWDNQEAGDYERASELETIGYYLGWATVAYGIASLTVTAFGFAAVHSTLRLPISVDLGFIITLCVSALVIAHMVHSVHLRNQSDA